MWSLTIVLVVLQVIFCNSSSNKPISALSCALGRFSSRSVNNSYRLSDIFLNRTYDTSVESNVGFRLYTREYPEGSIIYFKDAASLQKTGFRSYRPTRIITHGFNAKGTDSSCIDPTNAFLEYEDTNVIIMDWYNCQLVKTRIISYFEVVKKVKDVAFFLKDMINFLERYGMNPNTTTLIGHSLGAHLVGIAGYNTKSKVNHIVGLDPAEPQFVNKGPGERISIEDATHVEIIHTNGKHCGMLDAVGHYDFYLNGGSKQPGCKSNACSHSRVYEYYTESIRTTTGFYGRRCINSSASAIENCNGERALMGGTNRSRAPLGIYYVETNDQSPYAKGITFKNIKNDFVRHCQILRSSP